MSKIVGVHSGGRIGEIMDHGSSTLPTYALACDGAAYSRTVYAALFATIGTIYGAGDGSTTFNVPNGQALFKRGSGSQTVGGVALAATHGAVQGDQLQGFQVGATVSGTTYYLKGEGPGNTGINQALANNVVVKLESTAQGLSAGGYPVSNGSNGNPRTGTETRPANMSVTYGIVYK